MTGIGGKGVDMSEATTRIWTEAGIPAERITQLGGMNTSQEMIELRQFLGEHPPARVGLLTSAFHMPRAERLARKNGLQLTPIPAGFLGLKEPLPLETDPVGIRVPVVRVGGERISGGRLGALTPGSGASLVCWTDQRSRLRYSTETWRVAKCDPVGVSYANTCPAAARNDNRDCEN